jgi:hypothetical protein
MEEIKVQVEEGLHILTNKVLSQEQQERLTSADVIHILKQGNKEFVEDKLTVRDNTERVRRSIRAISKSRYSVMLRFSCTSRRCFSSWYRRHLCCACCR